MRAIIEAEMTDEATVRIVLGPDWDVTTTAAGRVRAVGAICFSTFHDALWHAASAELALFNSGNRKVTIGAA